MVFPSMNGSFLSFFLFSAPLTLLKRGQSHAMPTYALYELLLVLKMKGLNVTSMAGRDTLSGVDFSAPSLKERGKIVSF